MATRMQQRRGTAAEWSTANPILGDGEIGYAKDTRVFKVGDGVTAWNSLAAVSMPKTVRVPHTFTISGEVKVPSGDVNYIPPFFIPVPPGQTVIYRGLRTRINSGTSATFSVQRNGSSIGVDGLVSTPTSTTNTVGSGATFSADDQLGLVITAVNTAPKNMTVTVYLDYTV